MDRKKLGKRFSFYAFFFKKLFSSGSQICTDYKLKKILFCVKSTTFSFKYLPSIGYVDKNLFQRLILMLKI